MTAFVERQGLHFDETTTREERDRVRKIVTRLADQGPTSRQQSSSRVDIDGQMTQLGQGFDATKIPLSKLYQMRRDPMIGFALQFVKVPLIRAPWYIDCEDAQIAAFVDKALRRIYGRYVLQHSLCLDFGYQAMVKRFEEAKMDGVYKDPSDAENPEKPIWDKGTVNPVVWKPFTVLRPQDVEPVWTPSGDFDGFTFSVERTISAGFPGSAAKESNKHHVDVLHALWVTNERDSEFGSVWGYPRIGYAYRFWWSYWYNWALADRHFEKDADPPVIVRFPDGSSIETDAASGAEIEAEYRALALQMGEDSRSGATVALPSTPYFNEMDGRPTTMPQWDMKAMESSAANFEAFNNRFEYLDIAKLRAIMVPEQAFFEGKGGTSSRNVAGELGDRFDESQAVLMSEIDEHLNNFVIPQLVAANFPEFEGECRKVTKGFGSEDMELAKQLITLIGQADPSRLPVNTARILEEHGVPVLTQDEEQADFDKRMLRQQQMQMPLIDVNSLASESEESSPPAARTGVGQSQVTNTGFYQQPQERIVVPSDTETVFKVEFVHEIEGMPAAMGWRDKEAGVMYFREDVPEEMARDFVDMLNITVEWGETPWED